MMSKQRKSTLPFLLISLIFILAACTGAGTSAPADTASGDAGQVQDTQPPPATQASSPVAPTENSPAGPTEAPQEQDSAPEEPAGDRPAWQNVQLADVRTGETFTLGSFEGKVVIIEAMAVWCPLCDEQQSQINTALSQLSDDFMAVSLDVDPGETPSILADHADRFGLPWRFAIAGEEMSRLLQGEFGAQILTPPSTPVIIIGPDGSFELTRFGIKGADTLVEIASSMLP